MEAFIAQNFYYLVIRFSRIIRSIANTQHYDNFISSCSLPFAAFSSFSSDSSIFEWRGSRKRYKYENVIRMGYKREYFYQ